MCICMYIYNIYIYIHVSVLMEHTDMQRVTEAYVWIDIWIDRWMDEDGSQCPYVVISSFLSTCIYFLFFSV